MGKPLIDALKEAEMKKVTTQHRQRAIKPETPESLNQFLMERLRWPVKWTAHYVPQSQYVFDEDGRQIVKHVLKHENLHDEFTKLMADYNLPAYLNLTVNQRKSKSSSRMTVNDLFPETIQRINEVARQDFLKFDYQMIDVKAFRNRRIQEQSVQRIYYINLLKNTKRRKLMESWLSQQPIPFERINATIGSNNPEDCAVGKRSPQGRCRGISRLAKTELDIIRNHNTSGLTLVFEDDFKAKQPLDEVVERTLRLVPSDWDIIRWDCWGKVPKSFDLVVPGEHKVFRTVHQRECIPEDSPCWFVVEHMQ